MPLSKKRIGIVCPYGWDTPGGVKSHIGDLAEYLIASGVVGVCDTHEGVGCVCHT